VAGPWTAAGEREGDAWARLGAAWRVAGWPLVAALALAAFVLGAVGYRMQADATGVPSSTTEVAYRSLQLFVFETDQVPHGAVPWQLDAARFLAPAVTGVALIAAAALVFRRELEEVRLRRRHGHVVVCGLGRRGAHLAKELVHAGRAVVAVERDEEALSVCELRRAHVLVVVGDARDTDVLRRAGLPRASHVVAVTGSDDVNAEIVTRSGQLASGRRGPPLSCLADIKDPDLCVLLRAEELSGAVRRGFRLDFVNVYEQGARMMLDDHPPVPEDGVPRLAVIGLNQLGRGLIVEAARRWSSRAAADGPLDVVVVDPNVEHILEVLRVAYRRLLDLTRIRAIAADLDTPDRSWLEDAQPSAIYVCLDDHSASLEVALELCRCPAAGTAPIVAQMSGAAGLAALLDRAGAAGRLHLFNLPDRAFGADLLVGGTYEILARAIHERYRARRLSEGASHDADPALRPWEELPETLRESNRSQAAHVGVKLTTIGCGIVPSRDEDGDVPIFSADEVELLARMEHERWVEDRRREGWRPGPRDPEARTSPYLVPWEALGDEVRELDREAVLAIPALLSSAGYRIVRVPVPDRVTRPARPPRPAARGAPRGEVPAGHGRVAFRRSGAGA
jgi:voltage-gated potassium channel Kch